MYWRHFKTITKHKWYVMLACFKAGLYWQGIVHDLSKYSPTEFAASARFFQGEKKAKTRENYALAWKNHKAKNRHHWEFWTDFKDGKLVVSPMPPRYLVEMLCDWVGAGKAYNKGDWTINSFKGWYQSNKEKMVLHKLTRSYIELLIQNVENEKELYEEWFVRKRISDDYVLVELQGAGYQPQYELIPKHNLK